MAKEEGSKTVVYGGERGIEQEYCGTVGGQSTDFSNIDTNIKVSGLSLLGRRTRSRSSRFRLPTSRATRLLRLTCTYLLLHVHATTSDSIHCSKTNSIQGITWRLGYGIQDPTQPEGMCLHPTFTTPILTWAIRV